MNKRHTKELIEKGKKEVIKEVGIDKIPKPPANGQYNLCVNNGVLAWVSSSPDQTINPDLPPPPPL